MIYALISTNVKYNLILKNIVIVLILSLTMFLLELVK